LTIKKKKGKAKRLSGAAECRRAHIVLYTSEPKKGRDGKKIDFREGKGRAAERIEPKGASTQKKRRGESHLPKKGPIRAKEEGGTRGVEIGGTDW